MIGQIGSNKILSNEITISNRLNNYYNNDDTNIITYYKTLNNYNTVGGHMSISNNNNNDISLSHSPANKSETARTNDNVIEQNKNSQIKLIKSKIQIDITRNIRDNMSKPDFTNIRTPIVIEEIDNDQSSIDKYDDLAIPRLIRRQERQYIRHKIL